MSITIRLPICFLGCGRSSARDETTLRRGRVHDPCKQEKVSHPSQHFGALPPSCTEIAPTLLARADEVIELEILFAAALPVIAALGAAIARSCVRQQQKRDVYFATSAPALATWPS